MPKTGSLAINSMLEHLRDMHNYSVYSQIEGMPTRTEDVEYVYEKDAHYRKMLIDSILEATPRPTMYARHQNFLDFTEFYPDEPHPIYFSFVRHPVERQISWYYYIRSALRQFNDDKDKLNRDNLKPKQLKESLEDCIIKRRINCKWIKGKSIHFSPGPTHISQISYFCGHHPDCDVYESDALFQRALTNFEKRFVVAGVLENFNESIQVLEHYLPRYFKGLTNLLETNPELLQTNRNTFKPPVPNWVREMMAKNMSKEIEFYHIVRQRLIKQYLLIKQK